LIPSPEGKGIDSQSPEIAGKFLGETMNGVDLLGSGLLDVLDEFSMVGMIG
jgi:hypothetical protein